MVNGSGADSVELYRVNQGRGLPFTRLIQIVSGKRVPVSFDWGGNGAYRAGATCRFRSGLLDIWRAARKEGSWHLVGAWTLGAAPVRTPFNVQPEGNRVLVMNRRPGADPGSWSRA